MKLTDWYPGEIKPVRKGWYEHLYPWTPEDIDKYWWDGGNWMHKPNGLIAADQTRPWRGLAENPNVA